MHGVQYEGYDHQPYPHNLYLFLLSTIGLLGLIAFMSFLLTPLRRCWRGMSLPNSSLEQTAFAKTGVVIVIVVLVDQLKIEFMRFELVDYWHFLFAVCGVLVAVSDQARVSGLRTADHKDSISIQVH